MMQFDEMTPSIRHWYPSHLRVHGSCLLCDWIQLENIPFTNPFFDETLAKALGKPINSSPFRSTSTPDVLSAWSHLPHVPPTAFIFHVSRCGSTLLSQLLGLHPQCISLAEVPFFDDVLRLPFKTNAPETFSVAEALAAAIRIYGQQRTVSDRHLFIKLDSWHICFWQQLRALYPGVPFILLYRRPDEVVRSHRKLRGMHAVPGVIEPAVFGFDPQEIFSADLDSYLARVLSQYFGHYLDVAMENANTVLLNYAEGPLPLLRAVAECSGLPLDDPYLAQVEKRSLFHAKHPEKVFAEKTEQRDAAPYLKTAFARYDRLEHLRLQASLE